MSNTRNIQCPICGLSQESIGINHCRQCGWDLAANPSITHHNHVQIEKARQTWQQRRYNPELIPDLQRDPFETEQEFSQRLSVRPWYAGIGELQKTDYDIKTGRFPIRLKSMQAWIQSWIASINQLHLQLSRDKARYLYQQSSMWPIYAQIQVRNGQAVITTLHLATLPTELPIHFHSHKASNFADLKKRYIDYGDGTVIDTRTDLQWMRCLLGATWTHRGCSEETAKYPWGSIHESVQQFNQRGGFAHHTDWRVPTLEELKTLIIQGERPAIDRYAFPGTPGAFVWSGTAQSLYSDYAWYVDFCTGHVNYLNKYGAGSLRLVRSADKI
jgi:hypothetical protein